MGQLHRSSESEVALPEAKKKPTITLPGGVHYYYDHTQVHSADCTPYITGGIEETREQNGDSLQVPKSQGCNQGRQPVRAAEMPSTFPVVEMAEDNDVRLWNRGLPPNGSIQQAK
ncbi:hypothetical protein BDBG_01425 [Blastomyces gilchristii SLH14081]|uniref:Uncharacterized protein n=1 Tax=Blastomyces gilchristii (strain SLH14081) TaxID=559298 RepID=A0A179UD26_BLAGS|nr:uncharacterized protein BDBG_01425 [Blastomyces gilchristii SLH14081]OAT04951.1 hypothetical protein BDBG_01425 [Blastomyces gilchristii SLH14081]